MTGRFTDHHAYLVRLHLDLIDAHSAKIADLDRRIGDYFREDGPAGGGAQGRDWGLSGDEAALWAAKRDLLATIPGVSRTVAEQILAEIGPDMSQFETPGRLASCAGVAPGSDESAGRVKSARCRPGDTYLKGALGTAAMAAARTKDTFVSARYKRVRARRRNA